MSNKEITHVCLVETVYTLFLYMLLVEEEDYDSFFARHCYLLRSRRNYLNHIVSNYPTNDIINGFFVFFCIIHLLYDGHS